ncbi:MAG: Lrp/AsnC ligand binding domain-containing protein [Candidatus Thorarchaeota archaeon]
MAQIRVILQIYVESKDLDRVSKALCEIDSVRDVYEVTGEADLIIVVETPDVNAFRDVLKNEIMMVEGIRSTVSSVVTYVHKKDGRLTAEA